MIPVGKGVEALENVVVVVIGGEDEGDSEVGNIIVTVD